MDPLSVGASIIGVLSAVRKISATASALVSGWKEAPISIRSINSEMSALRFCLEQLKPFFQGRRMAPESRNAELSVQNFVAVLSHCVLTISELEKTMDTLKADRPLAAWTKLRWSSHEKKLNTLITRVRAATSSLNLILMIMTWYVDLKLEVTMD